MGTEKKKIVHVITNLSTGGAEMMLYKILLKMDRNKYDPFVVSLTNLYGGPIRQWIMDLGIPVYDININKKIPSPIKFLKLVYLIRRIKPDIIQGWMYHGNMVSQLLKSTLPGDIPVVWNVRQSVYNLKDESWLTAKLINWGARFSNRPQTILYNARISARLHEELGYQKEKTKVIPNGFDCELFSPNIESRKTIRSELGIDDKTVLIGLNGRYNQLKDHSTFLNALHLLRHVENIKAVLVGRWVNKENAELYVQIKGMGLADKVILLGEREDIPSLTSAFDIAVSSSKSEGFSNAIGEAMAVGVPCVVTDVGDSSWIVGDTGEVVPSKNPKALADAISRLIMVGEESRRELGMKARMRIKNNFSLSSVVLQYESVYDSLLHK